MNNPNKNRIPGQSGCVFVLGVGAIMIVLLILNAVFVKVFFRINLARIDERVFHAAQFILPIAMIFIEFWLYDSWVNRRNRKKQEKQNRSS